VVIFFVAAILPFHSVAKIVMRLLKEKNNVKSNDFRLLATITKKATSVIKGLFFYFVYVL